MHHILFINVYEFTSRNTGQSRTRNIVDFSTVQPSNLPEDQEHAFFTQKEEDS
jgi:hypothetical protein